MLDKKETVLKSVYITGDTHGNFTRIEDFCRLTKTKKNDVMIILGDVGLNYHNNNLDFEKKKQTLKLPITLFCIQGNHELRPHHVSSYKVKNFHGGKVYVDDNFPNQIFAIDGEIYDFNNKKCIVIGGAYSVDKHHRIARGYGWFSDEQPSCEIKKFVEKQIKNKIDVVLSHTCPLKYVPKEWFLNNIDQSMVDNSTEKWLDKIEENVQYNKWYCGHYHGYKSIDKIRFFYELIEKF